MALWDSVTESLGGVSTSTLLVGAAAVVLAPVVVPAVLTGLRPIVKTVLKGDCSEASEGRYRQAGRSLLYYRFPLSSRGAPYVRTG